MSDDTKMGIVIGIAATIVVEVLAGACMTIQSDLVQRSVKDALNKQAACATAIGGCK